MGIDKPYVEALKEIDLKGAKPSFKCRWDGEIECPVIVLEKDIYVRLPGKRWVALRNASFIGIGKRVQAIRSVNRSCLEKLEEESYGVADLNLLTEAMIKTWKLKEGENRNVR